MADIPELYPGEFCRVVIGSTIHGLNVANTDDLDLMGICVETPEQCLGMSKPFEQHTFRTQPEGHPSGPGDVDLTTYSLRKYLRLASNGNPTVINLLFVAPDFRHADGPLAEELRSLIPQIVSREAGSRYLGYMQAQRERLLGQRGQKHTGYNRRIKYESEPDADGVVYDRKYAMHLCRLAVQGIELLKTGHITLPVPEPNRETLMQIRQGEWTLKDIVTWSNELEADLKFQMDHTPLADHPDREFLNEWLVNTYLREWEAPREHSKSVSQRVAHVDHTKVHPIEKRYVSG